MKLINFCLKEDKSMVKRYFRTIYGEEAMIKRLVELYSDVVMPEYPYVHAKSIANWRRLEYLWYNKPMNTIVGVTMKLTTEEFEDMKKNVGLKDLCTRGKRAWELDL
ncbi:MAG: hypothetical protein KBT27_09420 [Prevotellaceae bacterium]|nr:hypothetical protein [Candidatus Faecinaster equi]